MTNSALILSLALAAEHLAIAYYAWILARRKGRMWLPYALFGLLGYVVLALRSPNRAVLDDLPRVTSRSAYTHTGFARPNADIPEAAYPRKKRRGPLDEYHLPRGAMPARARS